ncbi:STP1 protein, partial [Plasmodium malariae]
MIYGLLQFKNIENEIKQKTSSLINQHDKNKFREGCRDLANYLINNNNPPRNYSYYKKTWKGALNYWLKNYYRNLDKHGGCPLILEEKDKKFLKLKYEEVDFCEMKNEYLREIKSLSKKSKDSDTYRSKCNAYNAWIDQKMKDFEQKKNLFRTCYQKTKKNARSEFICDLMDPNTFEKLSDCHVQNNISSREAVSEKSEKGSQTQDQEKPDDPTISQESPKQGEKTHSAEKADIEVIPENKQESQKELPSKTSPELQTNLHISTSKSSDIERESSSTGDIQFRTSEYHAEAGALPSELPKIRIQSDPASPTSDIYKVTQNVLTPEGSATNSISPDLHMSSIILGKYLTHYHTKSTLYDDEEIIKKLKIHQHNTIKNTNILKRKKERFKTIIEVHMEVLEEFKNEKWEYEKGEFLDLCLELFAKAEYSTYRNLTNEELIMENTKSINDIKKQKIIWNKWVKEHSNISEKLKKTNWFNNLKNEWKNEKDFIK